MTDAFDAVAGQLRSADTLVSVFGLLSGSTNDEKKRQLRKSFAYLAAIVHPDHVPPNMSAQAAQIFTELSNLRLRAEEAILSGNYDTVRISNPSNTANTVFELVSTHGIYRLNTDVFREGDFSVVYRGVAPDGNTAVIAKVAREPSDNSWLEREFTFLRRMHDPATRSNVSAYVPKISETFLAQGDANKHYRVIIMPFSAQMVSIADIMRAYPNGLDAPQAAWVARRIIAQSIVAQMFGVAHGAIVPDHVLVDPISHDPLHIGWAHAITSGRITQVIDRWRDLYPPEVWDKKPPDHRTDIYMAAATIVRLMGGDVQRKSLPGSTPEQVARILLRCLDANPARRPHDGRHLLDEFTRIVRAQWGRVYRPLSLSVPNA